LEECVSHGSAQKPTKAMAAAKMQAPAIDVAAVLEAELQRLQGNLGTGELLTVVWLPNQSATLSGEVKGNEILIYEEESEKALETMRHEFVDFIVSKAAKPYARVAMLYRTMINALIGSLTEDAYAEKEAAIEALLKIIKEKRV
jgi:hypothetical protein